MFNATYMFINALSSLLHQGMKPHGSFIQHLLTTCYICTKSQLSLNFLLLYSCSYFLKLIPKSWLVLCHLNKQVASRHRNLKWEKVSCKQPVGYFLHRWLMWEGRAHRAEATLGQVVSEAIRQAQQTQEQANKQHPPCLCVSSCLQVSAKTSLCGQDM